MELNYSVPNPYDSNNIQLSNYNNSFYNNHSMALNDHPYNNNYMSLNKNNNFEEPKINNLINDSIHDYITQENKTREIFNELRSKYLPNSTRKSNNNFNTSQNMTYFDNNKNNPNLYFSTYTEVNNSFANRPYISPEKVQNNDNNKITNIQPIKDNSKIFQSSFLDNKELFNLNESIKNSKDYTVNTVPLLKKEDFKFDDSKDKEKSIEKSLEKSYYNNYLIEENEKLKKMNKNYEILISPLLDYINDLNYFFGQNTIDKYNINKLIKSKDLYNNTENINDLRSMLKISKNNIINFSKEKKSNSVPKSKPLKKEKNNYSIKMSHDNRASTYNSIKKNFDINDLIGSVKPFIGEKKSEMIEKNSLKNSDIGGIRKAKTFRQKIPTTYWSQNKKVKFVD